MTCQLKNHTTRKVSPGRPAPLGAIPDQNGTGFAIYAPNAEGVYLLLFDRADGPPTDTILLPGRTGPVWHGYVSGVDHGQLYAYKVQGSYKPKTGLHCNPCKLLIDPYARALTPWQRRVESVHLGYDPRSGANSPAPSKEDSTNHVPKCVVWNDTFDWQGVSPPDISSEDLVIYEAHVKGFTAHPSSGVRYPGTYLGFIEKIPHLQSLGVTAVELLPVQEAVTGLHLSRYGLTDYWAYNTIGFFAPTGAYAAGNRPGSPIVEFQTLIRELHRAGIAVILDVVYNHTGEGNETGPTLCFRGVDNSAYYLLHKGNSRSGRSCRDLTGTGNTLDVEKPAVLQLILDSLRYWVETMGVDGFRFDLAPVLGRHHNTFSAKAPFFRALAEDPVLRRVIWIAEPWDLSTHALGQFPAGWKEWNSEFRDTLRRFLRGDKNQLGDLARILTGSENLFHPSGRTPCSSVNYITSHDGFTLYDLFSYNKKHNQENREKNRDGTDDNFSWNAGHEGGDAPPDIKAIRKRLVRNAFCGLLFARGTPMLLGGDEMLRSQGGNNNAYCQDNPVSWFDWTPEKENREIFEFLRKAVSFRRKHPALRTDRFYKGKTRSGDPSPDIQWFGKNLTPPRWDDPDARLLCFQVFESFDNQKIYLFFIFNADTRIHTVRLPDHTGLLWARAVDTSLPSEVDFPDKPVPFSPQECYPAEARSVAVLVATGRTDHAEKSASSANPEKACTNTGSF
jgi:glycogen operon protein